jgi:hypothetical protein
LRNGKNENLFFQNVLDAVVGVRFVTDDSGAGQQWKSCSFKALASLQLLTSSRTPQPTDAISTIKEVASLIA